MGFLKKNLPSRRDYFRLFLICSLPVHIWAYIDLMNIMPAVLLQMSVWRIAGMTAYVLGFALIESLIIFGLFFLSSLVLPERVFKLKLLDVFSIFMISASIPAVFVHLHNIWEIESMSFVDWVIMWVLIGIATFVLFVVFLNWNRRGSRILHGSLERLVVLSTVYLSLDVIGLFLVVIRNVFASISEGHL